MKLATVCAVAGVGLCVLLVGFPGVRSDRATPAPKSAAPAVESKPSPGVALEKLISNAASSRAMKEREFEDSVLALGEAAVPAIEAKVTNPEAPLVRPMARAYCRLAQGAAMKAMMELARSEAAPRRKACALALECVQSPESVAELCKLLGDAEDSVATAAGASLAAMDAKNIRLRVRQTVESVFERSRDARARAAAARTLAAVGNADSRRVLERGLDDTNETVATAALDALSQLGTESENARVALVRWLREGERNTRMQAAVAAGKLKDRTAGAALIELLSSDDDGLKANAHWALCEISEYAFPPDPARWQEWWEREGSRSASPPAAAAVVGAEDSK